MSSYDELVGKLLRYETTKNDAAKLITLLQETRIWQQMASAPEEFQSTLRDLEASFAEIGRVVESLDRSLERLSGSVGIGIDILQPLVLALRVATNQARSFDGLPPLPEGPVE